MLLFFKSILTIILLALTSNLGSQNIVTGARFAAMGGCSVSLTGLWSVLNNQAGLSQIDNTKIGINYESKFMLSELSNKSIAIVTPLKYGVIGLSYNHFGFNLFNTQRVGLSFSRSFGNKLHTGLQLDYQRTGFGNGYGNSGLITFEIGIQANISDNVILGLWVFNPVRSKIHGTNEYLITILRFGICWYLSEYMLVTTEIEKNTDVDKFILKCGAEYNINKRYFIRAGVSSTHNIFSFGIGITIKKFTIDLSASYNNFLGFTTQSGLTFSF